MREQLEHLLRLRVHYAQVAEKAEFVPIPKVKPTELTGLKPKKRKARLNRSTLFTIRELRQPKDRFGRRVSESSEPSWRLDRPVEVRGHFKLQSHGPKQSKRKLIWIEPYIRCPKDQNAKPVLEHLSGKPNDA